MKVHQSQSMEPRVFPAMALLPTGYHGSCFFLNLETMETVVRDQYNIQDIPQDRVDQMNWFAQYTRDQINEVLGIDDNEDEEIMNSDVVQEINQSSYQMESEKSPPLSGGTYSPSFVEVDISPSQIEGKQSPSMFEVDTSPSMFEVDTSPSLVEGISSPWMVKGSTSPLLVRGNAYKLLIQHDQNLARFSTGAKNTTSSEAHTTESQKIVYLVTETAKEYGEVAEAQSLQKNFRQYVEKSTLRGLPREEFIEPDMIIPFKTCVKKKKEFFNP